MKEYNLIFVRRLTPLPIRPRPRPRSCVPGASAARGPPARAVGPRTLTRGPATDTRGVGPCDCDMLSRLRFSCASVATLVNPKSLSSSSSSSSSPADDDVPPRPEPRSESSSSSSVPLPRTCLSSLLVLGIGAGELRRDDGVLLQLVRLVLLDPKLILARGTFAGGIRRVIARLTPQVRPSRLRLRLPGGIRGVGPGRLEADHDRVPLVLGVGAAARRPVALRPQGRVRRGSRRPILRNGR